MVREKTVKSWSVTCSSITLFLLLFLMSMSALVSSRQTRYKGTITDKSSVLRAFMPNMMYTTPNLGYQIPYPIDSYETSVSSDSPVTVVLTDPTSRNLVSPTTALPLPLPVPLQPPTTSSVNSHHRHRSFNNPFNMPIYLPLWVVFMTKGILIFLLTEIW